ncbi:MAG: class I SAM-dependent methyltransferase [Acidobacteria bacterium]|nr:class I SAM-dependent methyltransferase [Acidobacteriota bacterium]
MSPNKDDAAGRDAAALARDLVTQISAISASLSSGLESRSGAPLAAPGAGPAYEWPRALLENAGRFVSPVLPAEAALRPLKAALLRLLRIVTRDQSTFNSALLEAVRGALLETEKAMRDVSTSAVAARDASRRAEEAAARVGSEAAVRLSEATAALEARLDAEAGAIVGNLHAGLERIDALERDRDVRFEVLARERERENEKTGEILRKVEEAGEGLRMLRLDWSSLRSNLQNVAVAGAPPEVRGSEAIRAHSGGGALRADDPLRAGLYVSFEEHFRGSEDEIRRRQKSDAALFRGAPGPVADLGCGRGEFLEALAAEGVKGIGCDANPVMAARAKEKKLAVDAADLFAWLAARPDGSLGGITAFQVVEHLAPSSLFDLVELSARKLAAGGRVLFETVNPESVYAMRWFWMDLTHVRPVPAPSLAQLLTASGFRDVSVDFRSPVPESEGLTAEAAKDPRLAPIARLLFAPQDYAVTGVK